MTTSNRNIPFSNMLKTNKLLKTVLVGMLMATSAISDEVDYHHRLMQQRATFNLAGTIRDQNDNLLDGVKLIVTTTKFTPSTLSSDEITSEMVVNGEFMIHHDDITSISIHTIKDGYHSAI